MKGVRMRRINLVESNVYGRGPSLTRRLRTRGPWRTELISVSFSRAHPGKVVVGMWQGPGKPWRYVYVDREPGSGLPPAGRLPGYTRNRWGREVRA